LTPRTTITAIGMDDILWRAGLGGALLGLAAGPIGCFVLWRRMVYLGSSIAEMALLGIALGLIIGVSPLLGVLFTSLVAALILARPWRGRAANLAREQRFLPADTRIGLVGHAGLALGFVLLAGMETVRADLLGYLFGDILALSREDVLLIAAVVAAALLVLVLIWRPLLADTVSPDILAAEEGGKGRRVEALFLLLVAGLIAFGLKLVGALLIVALLVIPPAAARIFARDPETMAILAALIAAAAAPLGLCGAYVFDAPAGPAIVLAAAFVFACFSLAALLLKR
jgi:zinc transport system permease protein